MQIIESSDIYAESEWVAAKIRELVINHGYKYHEIAVVSRVLSDYSSVLEGALARYDVEYFMDSKRAIAHQAVMLTVSSALEVASAKSPSTEAILRLIKSGLAGIAIEEISQIEDYCYKWSVNKEMWLSPFNADGDEEEIRKKIILPLENLKNSCQNVNGSEICVAIYKYMDDIKLAENLIKMSETQDLDAESLEILREQKQLWNMLISILDKLYIALANVEITISEFSKLLKMMMLQAEFANPPQTLDAVTVTSAERGRLASPKVVFVVGANDGMFPFTITESGFFTEKDKRLLEDAGISLSMDIRGKIAEERFIVYNTLSAASERLYISYSLSDTGGKVRYPSSVLNRIASLFTNDIVKRTTDFGVAFYSSTDKSAYYNYVQEYSSGGSGIATLRSVLLEYEQYANKVDYIEKFDTTYKHRIENKALLKSLFGKRLSLSASRLEEFEKCKFQYFCTKGLKLHIPEKVSIDARYKGNIIHNCFYSLLKSNSKDEFIALGEEQILEQIVLEMDKYLESNMGGTYGKTAKFKAAFSRLKNTILESVLHVQRELEQSKFTPVDFELVISDKTGVFPKKLISSDGIEIFFSGTVDRVDEYIDTDGSKYIRIVDYKSGSFNFSFEELYYGIHVQALLYLLTLAGNGKYSEHKAAGSLYMPSGELSAEDTKNRQEFENIISVKDKQFTMDGVVLKSLPVLEAMDKETNGVFIKATISKDGQFKGKSILSENQMKKLNNYVEKLIISAADSIYNGDFSAIPLVEKERSTPCQYCKYWSICGNYPNRETRELNKKVAGQMLLNEIEEEKDAKTLDDGTTTSN